MVALSKPTLSTVEQSKKVDVLNRSLIECEVFRNAQKKNMFLNRIGDAIVTGVSDDPTFPIELAIQLHEKLQQFNEYNDEDHKIKIRIGIHSGPTVRGDFDEWGEGLIGAKRIMDLGTEDHILVSSKTATDLIQLSPRYREILHPLGDYVVKHDQVYSIHSAYGNNFGNPNSPTKLATNELQTTANNKEDKFESERFKTHSISISVNCDKSVYPLNSKVYVRTKLNDIILGQPIKIEVYDSNNKMLVERKIDPVTFNDKQLKSGGIYQTEFIMKGEGWKIREAYTIIAKHGKAESRDSFIVDRRWPVVQTDRSVYLMGSTMILTVIDPDYNRDSQKAETAGHRPDSMVTITTSLGTVRKYKLVETGKDTGIFQGTIEVTPSHYIKKGQRFKWRAGGSGPTDGHIPVYRGELIKITYSNDNQCCWVHAFSSNFGAAIELDSKNYTPTDKVSITVVAPDYNLDPNKVDVIGNKIDNKITIVTSVDKVTKYKLVETDKDTGIFTGVITLKEENNKSRLKRNISRKTRIGLGPNAGVITTSSSDEIKVIFETDAGSYSGSARIHPLARSQFNIESTLSPLDRISISDLKIIDDDNNSVKRAKVNQSLTISATINNNQNVEQPFAFLVQIQNEDRITIGDILSNTGILSPLQSFNPILSWLAPAQGKYYIQIFIWETIDKPSSLSPPSQLEIIVT